jgi:hypothetical protein
MSSRFKRAEVGDERMHGDITLSEARMVLEGHGCGRANDVRELARTVVSLYAKLEKLESKVRSA